MPAHVHRGFCLGLLLFSVGASACADLPTVSVKEGKDGALEYSFRSAQVSEAELDRHIRDLAPNAAVALVLPEDMKAKRVLEVLTKLRKLGVVSASLGYGTTTGLTIDLRPPKEPQPVPVPDKKDKPDASAEKPKDGKEKKEPVSWPLLSVSGLVGKGDKGTAIINNEIVQVGESILGAKVLSVDPVQKGVTLEYKGEQRFMKVGQIGAGP